MSSGRAAPASAAKTRATWRRSRNRTGGTSAISRARRNDAFRYDCAGFVPVVVVNTKVSRPGPANSSRCAVNAAARGAGIELHAGLIARHLIPQLGDVGLARVTTAEVRQWYAARPRAGLGRSTVAKAYRLLKTISPTPVQVAKQQVLRHIDEHGFLPLTAGAARRGAPASDGSRPKRRGNSSRDRRQRPRIEGQQRVRDLARCVMAAQPSARAEVHLAARWWRGCVGDVGAKPREQVGQSGGDAAWPVGQLDDDSRS